MHYYIRKYKPSDYKEISSWFKKFKEPAPLFDMLNEETTFISFIDGLPAYTLTVYLTNCKEICYLENFARNPDIQDNVLAQDIANYVYQYAKEKGYKRVLAFSYRDKLKKKYQDLGMKKTLDNLSSFVREL